MDEFLDILIGGIMDAIEEFFDALTVPSRRYTLYAFFVSLIFLGWSIVAELFELATFVNWQEAVTCSVLLLIIVMIDSSTRSKISGSLKGIKSVASRFSYTGVDEDDEDETIQEEMEYGTGEQRGSVLGDFDGTDNTTITW